MIWVGLPGWLSDKESAFSAEDTGACAFNPWVRRILWRRKWEPTPLFLPGESHGQRSLTGYIPNSHKESNMPEWLSTVVISNYSLTRWASIISGRIMIRFIAVGRACGGEIAYHSCRHVIYKTGALQVLVCVLSSLVILLRLLILVLNRADAALTSCTMPVDCGPPTPGGLGKEIKRRVSSLRTC